MSVTGCHLCKHFYQTKHKCCLQSKSTLTQGLLKIKLRKHYFVWLIKHRAIKSLVHEMNYDIGSKLWKWFDFTRSKETKENELEKCFHKNLCRFCDTAGLFEYINSLYICIISFACWVKWNVKWWLCLWMIIHVKMNLVYLRKDQRSENTYHCWFYQIYWWLFFIEGHYQHY